MISYELAKKLKDAGFPQYDNEQSCVDNGEILYKELRNNGMSHEEACIESTKKGETCYIPTLSELIEACGDKFHGIYVADNWKAHGFKSDNEFDDVYVMGSTPEEAVANLWIELNKK